MEAEIPLDGDTHERGIQVEGGWRYLEINASPTGVDRPADVAYDADLQIIAPDGNVALERSSSLSAGSGGSSLPSYVDLVDAAPGTWTLRITGTTVPTQAWHVTIRAIDVAGTLPEEPAALGHERIVVAVVDSGIDPYHRAFQAARPATVAEGLATAGVLHLPIQPTGGNSTGWEDDAPTWYSLEPFQPYHIPTTNVIYMSPTRAVPPDSDDHGTAVASIVASRAPQAQILSVRVADERAQMVEVLRWLTNIDGIDIINLSWADPANPAAPSSWTQQLVNATREAHRSGKLVIAAAGNAPRPTATQVYSGPPWVVSVALADEANGSDNPNDRFPPDVVTNNTIRHAAAYTGIDYETGSATSWAAPNVAGILAKAARLYHEATGEKPSAQALRAALNATATYPEGTAYTPEPGSPLSLPVAPTPALQYGWGFIGDPEDPRRLADCLIEDCPLDKPPDTEVVMEASHRSRQATWG